MDKQARIIIGPMELPCHSVYITVKSSKADIYNCIISQRSLDSWTHNCDPLYSTVFNYSKLIMELVTIMLITIANDCSDLDIQENYSSKTNTRSTEGHNTNTNIMFTLDKSLLNVISPDINYTSLNCLLKGEIFCWCSFLLIFTC